MFRGCFSKTSGSYLQQDTYPLLSMKFCCKTKETLEAIINFLKTVLENDNGDIVGGLSLYKSE